MICRVHTTPANKAESPEFDTMVQGAKAQRILAELPMIAPMVRATLATPMPAAPIAKRSRASIATVFACSLEPMALTGSLRPLHNAIPVPMSRPAAPPCSACLPPGRRF